MNNNSEEQQCTKTIADVHLQYPAVHAEARCGQLPLTSSAHFENTNKQMLKNACSARADMCAGMCADMCAGMCAGMCTDMCAHMWLGVVRACPCEFAGHGRGLEPWACV